MSYRLDARYDEYDTPLQLTGIQAIARTILEARRVDVTAGLNTAGFVSGYPGSPLAGLDLALGRLGQRLAELGIVHQRGVNEELAATAVFGSQLVQGRERATVDGVTGWWYGNAPGLDRAADELPRVQHLASSVITALRLPPPAGEPRLVSGSGQPS